MSYNPLNARPHVIHLHPDNTPIPIHSNYSPKSNVSIFFSPDLPVYTKQEFKDECDINVLMSKYQSSGELPNLNEREPQYLDATGYDYQEHMNFIAGANSLFQELPSWIRNRFDNDPAKFLDFTSQESNRSEMAEMGLLKPVSEWVSVPPSENSQEPPAAEQVPSTPNSSSSSAPE